MPRAIARILFGAMSAVLLSCGSPAAPFDGHDASFATNADVYLAIRIPGSESPPRYRFEIVTRFENRGVVPLYLGRCFPDTPQPLFSVDVVNTTGIASAYSQVWGCVGHNRQFVVLPGAHRIDTLAVEGPNMIDGTPQQAGGTFRMYFDVRLAPGDGAPEAPLPLHFSNTFVVRTFP